MNEDTHTLTYLQILYNKMYHNQWAINEQTFAAFHLALTEL